VPVLIVPRSAVIQKGDKTLVFVSTGKGTFEEREVETGVNDANDTEIRKGLALGEKVVERGATILLGAAMKTSEGR